MTNHDIHSAKIQPEELFGFQGHLGIQNTEALDLTNDLCAALRPELQPLHSSQSAEGHDCVSNLCSQQPTSALLKV